MRLTKWSWLWAVLVGASFACNDPDAVSDAAADADTDARALADAKASADQFVGADGSVKSGAKDRLLLRGTVVTPDKVLSPGEVLTDKDRIVCVARDCSSASGAKGASIIDTRGLIFPGLIDAHNHTQYDYLPKWKHSATFTNHNQWQSNKDYSSFISPHRTLDNTLMCEMIKYGEIRALIAGTTSIQGTPLRRCADTLIRNVDLPYDGLGDDTMRTNVLGVSQLDATDAKKLRDEFSSGKTEAYVIHLAEGTDETARKEFDALEKLDLLKPQVVIIHGTALTKAELSKVAKAKMGIVWSPSSNIDLYGKTNDMTAVHGLGIPVALAPDWTPSGQPNVLGELSFAAALDRTKLKSLYKPAQLVKMVTSDAAKVLRLGDELGRLAKGLRADLTVISGDPQKPYEALLRADLTRVQLVIAAGKPLYGNPVFLSPLAPNSYCETLTVCGSARMVCVKESTDSTDKLNQSLTDIENALKKGYKPGPLALATCPST